MFHVEHSPRLFFLGPMSKLNLFVKFNTISKADEEQRLVSGYASTEALDSQGEVITLDALKAALPDYMKFANIREMHQAMASGKAVEATIDDKGLYIVAKVVDDTAWKKVKESVYQGFSVGGKVVAREGNKILKMKLSEISLVDRPSNPEATYDMWKVDDPSNIPTKHLPQDIKDLLEKVQTSGKLAKGMGGVSSLAWIIDSLSNLKISSEYEAEYEGDNSPIPGRIKEVIAMLGQVLVDMVAEEVSEVTAKAAPGGPIQGGTTMKTAEQIAAEAAIAKMMGDRSKTYQDLAKAMEAIANLTSKLTAPTAEELEAAKADLAVLAKAQKSLADALAVHTKPVVETKEAAEPGGALNQVLEILNPMTATMESMAKRLKAIEDTPVPARSLAKGATITKEEDGAAAVEGADAAPKTAEEAIRKAMSKPMPAKAFDASTNEQLSKL